MADDDDDRTYTLAERQRVQSPPCPRCKGPTTQEWELASGFGEGPKRYRPGMAECRNECWRG